MAVSETGQGRWLEDLTWPEAEVWFRRNAVMMVPIGAASKEHGHHLPLCTDYLLARGICDGVLDELPVLAAPVVSFGYYPAFRHYPGSQHLEPDTFAALLRDLLKGFIAQGLQRIVVVNTGISTEPIVNVTLRELYELTGVRIAAAHISRLGKSADGLMQQAHGGHGDEHETSLIKVLAPDRVREGKAQQDYGNLAGHGFLPSDHFQPGPRQRHRLQQDRHTRRPHACVARQGPGFARGHGR